MDTQKNKFRRNKQSNLELKEKAGNEKELMSVIEIEIGGGPLQPTFIMEMAPI